MAEEIKFQERIKELRSERNMTQQQLGDLLGVTGQAVSKWETGLATPDIMLLPKVAKLFGCTIDSLFFGSDGTGSDDCKTMTRLDLAETKIENSNLRGVVMRDVVMDGAEIFDSRLNGMRIHHGGMANLSMRHLDLDGLSIGFSQMNGAIIHDLGGHTIPIRFAENDFKGSTIDRCDLAYAELTNCNLSGLRIIGSTLRDSWLLQPDTYDPLHMEDVDLHDSLITGSNLSGLRIVDCEIDGMTINGVSVKQLIDDKIQEDKRRISMVTVRKANETDLVQVAKLSELWVSENITYGLGANSEQLLRTYIGDYFWVAEADSQVIGYITGTVHVSNGLAVIEKGEHYLEVDEVYVHPAYRNENIGHMLVDRLLQTAEENRITRSIVYSATKQWQNIIGFYEKHGFTMWFVQMYR
ncbi:GNAT family N-acetyltransferase [Paenibacillus mesophilus]|uniref:GNAT family N-acetyltransferase n=1 Tax=Paenibacillus mesophilus TaxID=2582849 RepID=UPI001EE41ABB|nr:GNAT family N-acetyltransferase [Paenibacillus mesophilus]